MGDWPLSSISFYQTSNGKSIVAHASANTKGAYVECIASTTRNVAGIYILAEYCDEYQFLIDIAVGAAGSEVVIIPNLTRGSTVYTKYNNWPYYFFPINIPGYQSAT